MTDTKPAALSLAEDMATTAVLEIRRLHEINAELLEALKEVAMIKARTAIATAEESK